MDNLDEPTIGVREHVREVIATERGTYRSLARVFAQQGRNVEYTSQELTSLFSTLGEEDKDRIEREIGARS